MAPGSRGSPRGRCRPETQAFPRGAASLRGTWVQPGTREAAVQSAVTASLLCVPSRTPGLLHLLTGRRRSWLFFLPSLSVGAQGYCVPTPCLPGLPCPVSSHTVPPQLPAAAHTSPAGSSLSQSALLLSLFGTYVCFSGPAQPLECKVLKNCNSVQTAVFYARECFACV